MLSENGLFTVIVVGRQDETSEVVTLELALPDAGDLPTWTPGAHVDIAVGELGLRQYSLCGDPDDRGRWRVGVLFEKDGRGGSQYLHREAAVGCTLAVSLPRNNFPLIDSASYVFIAGGIGITPILPMVAAAEAAGARWTLYYGGRAREHMAYLAELAQIGPGVTLLPHDEFGLLPLESILERGEPDSAIYCCGPEPLEAAHTPGRGGTLHVERFKPRPTVADIGGDSEFEVRIASTGATIRIGAGQSILDAFQDAGIEIATSCREGTCASCETAVLDGDVIHRDSVLSENERQQSPSMMVCVSRAKSGMLVLDL
jgi:ferredoxin-NADP reductase